MKILCVSDSHGDLGALMEIVELHPDAKLLLHMGDGTRELEELQSLYPKLEYAAVQGNCDRTSNFPPVQTMILRGVKILMTHGHLYGVKRTLSPLYELAAQRGVSLCLFGHTHQPHCERQDGIWYLNPGSISTQRGGGSYGLVCLDDKRVKECWLSSL